VSALRQIDRVLALVAVAATALVVVMLLAGPAVVASDQKATSGASAGYGSSAKVDGAQLFKSNCGSCHTLSAAGTSGAVGPNLDNVSLSPAEIEAKVRSGGGAMPSFSGKLSDKEIKAVAAYVSGSH
jgi:mono/diheme cytochrome c family protein